MAKAIAFKILGVILILGGIAGIFLPLVPGDVLILSGLTCLCPAFANWIKKLYLKYPKWVKVYGILSIFALIGMMVLTLTRFGIIKWPKFF